MGQNKRNLYQPYGKLCPETNVIAVNRSGIERPGMLANVWNINNATFLITAQSAETVESILNKLSHYSKKSENENIQTIKVDRIGKRI